MTVVVILDIVWFDFYYFGGGDIIERDPELREELMIY